MEEDNSSRTSVIVSKKSYFENSKLEEETNNLIKDETLSKNLVSLAKFISENIKKKTDISWSKIQGGVDTPFQMGINKLMKHKFFLDMLKQIGGSHKVLFIYE